MYSYVIFRENDITVNLSGGSRLRCIMCCAACDSLYCMSSSVWVFLQVFSLGNPLPLSLSIHYMLNTPLMKGLLQGQPPHTVYIVSYFKHTHTDIYTWEVCKLLGNSQTVTYHASHFEYHYQISCVDTTYRVSLYHNGTGSKLHLRCVYRKQLQKEVIQEHCHHITSHVWLTCNIYVHTNEFHVSVCILTDTFYTVHSYTGYIKGGFPFLSTGKQLMNRKCLLLFYFVCSTER